MASQLPEDVLLEIFSFLDAFSLLQVSKVSKYWKNVAETESLWRNLCVQKWFLRKPFQLQGTQTWKQHFLHLTKKERQMGLAQPEDFNVKEPRGNFGLIGPMAYFSGPTPDEQEKSILCTVSSNCTLYAWDVQEGTVIWRSPVQRSRLLTLTTLPQMRLVFTVDVEGTVKMWNCLNEDALGVIHMPDPCFSLESCLTAEGPFLMVGSIKGNIHTLTVPELQEVSKVNAFTCRVDFLQFSPDKKWLFASGTHQAISPMIYLTECLLSSTRSHLPLILTVPYASCCRISWASRKPNRIVVMFRNCLFKRTGFITFDLRVQRNEGRMVVKANPIASFQLPARMKNPAWMKVSDRNLIAFESGPRLFLYTIHGHMMKQFDCHLRTISSLWSNSVHLLTTTMDDSVHMYMWEEDDNKPYLKRCFQLRYTGPLRDNPHYYVSRAICDNRSIVFMVSKSRDFSTLLMYSLKNGKKE
ncbi:F-box/WD repeat-containing protein 12-like [Suncus etruscus]|uniref:F-box/WD repeat-containing protein 12-like n=1 Tax=Suncus etruscus TaxID=109475 RepID=UPI00210FE443|nr:F-box/WD repeat-containing protein 12-like [Suncus etruscus]